MKNNHQDMAAGECALRNPTTAAPQILHDIWSTALESRTSPIEGESLCDLPEVLVVRVRLNRLGLSALLNAGFTQQCADIVVHNDDDALIGFRSVIPLERQAHRQHLQRGLEAKYAGAIETTPQFGMIASQRIQQWLDSRAEPINPMDLAGRPLKVVQIGGKLVPAVVEELKTLGIEAKAARRHGEAHQRSCIRLDRYDEIQDRHGESHGLTQLASGTEVMCPMHVDDSPTAVIRHAPHGATGIQCSHCKLTFWTDGGERIYDFGRFDRVINELAQAPENASPVNQFGIEVAAPPIQLLKDYFLPRLDVFPGITLVKSPKGTGKTEALSGLLKQCRSHSLRVLLLGHRRSLLQSISERLGLTCYLSFGGGRVGSSGKTPDSSLLEFSDQNDTLERPALIPADANDVCRASPTTRYAICLDSMTELNPEDKKRWYDVVIIDESEQVTVHRCTRTISG